MISGLRFLVASKLAFQGHPISNDALFGTTKELLRLDH